MVQYFLHYSQKRDVNLNRVVVPRDLLANTKSYNASFADDTGGRGVFVISIYLLCYYSTFFALDYFLTINEIPDENVTKCATRYITFPGEQLHLEKSCIQQNNFTN